MARATAHRLPAEEQLDIETLADIARGGMGRVQLGRVRSGRLAGKFVAVKRLNPEHEKDPQFVDMFLDEAWMTSAITSPNVIAVEAWGRDMEGLFLAIELVQGVSLSRLIKESRAQKEPFAERTVAVLVSQICAGLEVAHDVRGDDGEILGLVHRDLTPGNILVSFDGVVKIADFGIAKAKDRLTETSAGVMKGKPAYMAPEQARGGSIDRRADLFSVGVILYELLAGKRPWGGGDDLETLIAMSATEAPPLQSLRKCNDLFPALIDRCLKKNPEERVASAREIRDALDGWRRERGFLSDDIPALASFIQRNTPTQIAWYKRALEGATGGATFREIEEKIDRERHAKTGDSKVTPTPGSGPSDLKNMPGWGARSKGTGVAKRPSVIPPGAPAAPAGQADLARVPPPPRAPSKPDAEDLASTQLYTGPNDQPAPASVAVPPSQAVVSLRDLTSTVALDQAPPPSRAPSFTGSPSPNAYVPAPMPASTHAMSPVRPSNPLVMAQPLESIGAEQPPPSAAYRGERGGPRPMTSEATQIGSALVMQKKQSMTKVVVLVVLIVVAALAVAGYLLRDHLGLTG